VIFQGREGEKIKNSKAQIFHKNKYQWNCYVKINDDKQNFIKHFSGGFSQF
jgi:hypothetical protein